MKLHCIEARGFEMSPGQYLMVPADGRVELDENQTLAMLVRTNGKLPHSVESNDELDPKLVKRALEIRKEIEDKYAAEKAKAAGEPVPEAGPATGAESAEASPPPKPRRARRATAEG